MISLISMGFSLGLSLSGTCAASCMPVLASYVASGEHPTILRGLYSSVLFSLGRLIPYLILGLLFGLIAASVQISTIVTTIATLLLGCLVILHGLSALGLLKTRALMGVSLCKYAGTKRAPVYLGILTGLRPCIPLIAAITYGITLAGISEMLLFMLAFWLGSSLILLLVGSISGGFAGAASKKLTTDRFRRISGMAMVVVGLFFMIQAAAYLIGG